MGSKSTPIMILMTVVTLVCAAIIVPAAAGALLLLPVFAQQEETSLGERENIASGIISNVLDGSSDNDDVNSNDEDDEGNDDGAAAGEDDGDGDSNTQIAVPITDQDQREATLAAQLGLDADIVEEEEVTPTPPSDRVPPPPECSLEITTDKETYEPGDTIVITITNTGDVPLEFPDSFLGLEIRNLDTEEVLLLDAQPVIVTFEPGASATFQFTYERLVDEIGAGSISASVPSQCDTVEEVTFTLSAPPPPPIPTVFCLTVEFTSTVIRTPCFSTEEECDTGEEILRGSALVARIVSSCIGFETLPQGGERCTIFEGDPSMGIPRGIAC